MEQNPVPATGFVASYQRMLKNHLRVTLVRQTVALFVPFIGLSDPPFIRWDGSAFYKIYLISVST